MPYKQRIKTLEESYRLAENQLFHLEKTGTGDLSKIPELKELKDRYLTELRKLNRAQWDHDHETVNLDDDR